MNISVEHNASLNICCGHVTGTVSGRSDVRGMLDEILPVAAQHSCTRFLFDLREAKITAGTTEVFNTGADLTALGFDRSKKAAIVYSQDDSEHRFLETVATNRGHGLRIFKDVNQAISWLTGDEPSDQSLEGTR